MTGIMNVLVAAQGAQITLNASYAANAVTASPTNAVCQFELTNGGDIRMTTVNNTVNDVGDWIAPKFGFSAYTARMTVNSGTLTSGTTGSDVNLGTTRTWTLSAVTGLNASCTLQIKDATSGTVLATATVTFHAEVTP